ncbi:hypothetical protein U9J35_04105 [Rossellomorea aquimaris]|nr:hypothetical protein [Rossellomorea aquimaris]WRP07359.1 hypothetical protein U9J35_04105 [Rossellomorea aquimaris]
MSRSSFSLLWRKPEEIVYDQDRLISVSENAGDLILTKEFQAYQQTRKFSIYLCRKKRDPESKGKIENVVKYIKYNFSKNRVYSSLDVLNAQCIKWLSRTGNYNVHYTTKKRPFEVHALEKQHLQKVSTYHKHPFLFHSFGMSFESETLIIEEENFLLLSSVKKHGF